MSEQPDGFGNWCPECGERRDLCQCGIHSPGSIWDFESEVYEFDWSADDWIEDYDYTEGDIGQDGII